MAFNKQKTVETAQKFVTQGKFSEATREYQQILRYDPSDQVTLMTMGDLFTRQGDMTQAVEYFDRLAQVYLTDGFNSKAIAIYKKIAKLAPNEIEPLERLSELYIQQGILSEARPIILQIAEVHVKANRVQKAIEVIKRLVEVEPENPRVQMKLAELYSAIGQKKEAANTYLQHARRLWDRGNFTEASNVVDHALAAEPEDQAAIMLKAQLVARAGNFEQAVELLLHIPGARDGGETTTLLILYMLKAGKNDAAIELGRSVFLQDSTKFAFLSHVASSLTEADRAAEAFPILLEIRDAMIEAGEQDKFGDLLSSSVDRLGDQVEPLQALADFYRRTSDSFRLPDTLLRLADAAVAHGQIELAHQVLSEMVERNPHDEKLLTRLYQFRHDHDLSPAGSTSASEGSPGLSHALTSGQAELSEDTERYIAQALTDVDLFASYGLTQKAAHLLENVLNRAPGHVPTLERLLDVCVGSGNDRRSAEITGQLEQIYLERGDTLAAERYTELRKKYTAAALLKEAEASSPIGAEAEISGSVVSNEFVIVAGDGESQDAPSSESPDNFAPSPESTTVPTPILSTEAELDLSDDWEALSAGTLSDESTPAAQEHSADAIAESPTAELQEPSCDASAGQFEIEVLPVGAPATATTSDAMTTDDLMADLAADVKGLESMVAGVEARDFASAPPSAAAPSRNAVRTSSQGQSGNPPVSDSGVGILDGHRNELEEVFQEFRSELGEMGDEDEDLETHYNLGIAYREMGLLDEAIGEFQRVAKAIQSGKPFRYAMQCATLLGLTFMDKNEPKVASMWYNRALLTPGIDHETILALRYDLGVAQELAGDSAAALDSFRQVYAMNIDYRDVAARIATLQKR
ncbi:MAG: tetratricopeptide repeat protein [Candidatus Acidiferrales bacterium]